MGPGEDEDVEHLHDRRAWLNAARDDGEDSDGIAENDPRGKERKKHLKKWGCNPDYSMSFRYHQNVETELMAQKRMRAIDKWAFENKRRHADFEKWEAVKGNDDDDNDDEEPVGECFLERARGLSVSVPTPTQANGMTNVE